MATPQFSITFADGKSVAAQSAPDKRSLAERMFTTFNKVTGEVSAMPVVGINCTTSTAKDQGISRFDLQGKIPLLLNYKGAVEVFKGLSKGRDFVVIGARAGKNGSGGLMLAVNELEETAQHLLALHAALKDQVAAYRASLAGVAPAQAQGAPATIPVKVGPTRVDLDSEDDGDAI